MPQVIINVLGPWGKQAKRLGAVVLKKGEQSCEWQFGWTDVRVAKNTSIRIRAVYDESNGGYALVVLNEDRQVCDTAGYARAHMSIGLGARLQSGHYISAMLDLGAQ